MPKRLLSLNLPPFLCYSFAPASTPKAMALFCLPLWSRMAGFIGFLWSRPVGKSPGSRKTREPPILQTKCLPDQQASGLLLFLLLEKKSQCIIVINSLLLTRRKMGKRSWMRFVMERTPPFSPGVRMMRNKHPTSTLAKKSIATSFHELEFPNMFSGTVSGSSS